MSEGIPYLELKDGLRFYGLRPSQKDKKYYKLASSKVKKILPFEHYKVALDILIRFIEGGLKMGGPGKEMFYKVKPGDIVAEMGSYMGYYTMYLASKVGKKGRVIAIEPMPDNLSYLKKNIEYNGLTNVTIVEKGVWNKNEMQTFYQVGHDTQSASLILDGEEKKKFQIEVNSLDTILENCKADYVDLMLIQLNGIEPEALEGLQKLKPQHLAVAARYKSGEDKPVPRISKILAQRGYESRVIKEDYIYASLK